MLMIVTLAPPSCARDSVSMPATLAGRLHDSKAALRGESTRLMCQPWIDPVTLAVPEGIRAVLCYQCNDWSQKALLGCKDSHL